jgi:glucose-1-phosphate thymidylyltransferase
LRGTESPADWDDPGVESASSPEAEAHGNLGGSDSGIELVGLVPAAGHAQRLAHLPCSKEIFPIGFDIPSRATAARPRVACHYLFDSFRIAGANKAFLVLREPKWDIPAYLGDGSGMGLPIAYLVVRVPYGAPFTLDQAYPFVRDSHILFGFPDIIFEPDDAFIALLEKQRSTDADLVLGLFPAHRPEKMDMVELSADGKVRSIVIKPERTELQYTWIIAVWTQVFTQFLHEHLAQWLTHRPEPTDRANQEIFVGHVVQEAVYFGLRVESVLFPEGRYLDIGTPEDLIWACTAGFPEHGTR